ncbi:MAG TPA: hypothetical protein VJ577_01840 [Burkholderiaceae bacterium]|nr:hypothetical protein [Burkholderiaceae bacterium]
MFDGRHRFRSSKRLLISLVFLAGCSTLHVPVSSSSSSTYTVVDTGLEQSTLYGPGVLGAWLDNDRLLVNALQDAPGAQEKWRLRLVVFDTRTQETTEIAKDVHLNCFHPESRTAVLVEGQSNVPNFKDRLSRFVTLDQGGRFLPAVVRPDMNEFCVDNGKQDRGRLQHFLRPGDGYIDLGRTGGGYSTEPAILYRRNEKPVTLPIVGGELESVRYVRHLDLYQVGVGKYRMTDKHIYKFLTRDGKVVNAPRPYEAIESVHKPSVTVSDAGGVAYAVSEYVLRDGIIVLNTGGWKKNPGMFFIRNAGVTSIDASNGYLVERLLPSPDGCKLAYLYFKNYDFNTKKVVKIANFCR